MVAERRATLLHHADPLLVVEPEVAVGDHVAGLSELELGAEDQPGGASDGGPHLATRRIQRHGAGRIHVGEAAATTDELETA
jgi:hypothetical protein